MADTNVIVKARLGFAKSLWEPSAAKGSTEKKFSVQLYIDASDTEQLEKIRAAIAEAERLGADKLKDTPLVKQRRPLIKGEDHKTDPFFKGKYVLNASNKAKPAITKKINGALIHIVDESEVYSGCWAFVHVNFFPYNNMGVGIGCSLQSVMKWKNDERLDGRISAEAAFADVNFDTDDTPIEAPKSRFDDED